MCFLSKELVIGFEGVSSSRKTAYGNVAMVLMSGVSGQQDMCEESQDPMSFEKLGQPFGFVTYIKVFTFFLLAQQ